MLRILLTTIILIGFLSCNEDLTNFDSPLTEDENSSIELRSNSNLWVNFHRGGDNQYIYTTLFEENSNFDEDFPEFSGGYRLPTNMRTKKTPAGLHFNNDLFLYWKGEQTENIWVSKTSCDEADNGNNWTAPSEAITSGCEVSPTAVVWNNKVFLFFVSDGSSSDILYASSTDGINFGPSQRITRTNSSGIVRNFHPSVEEQKVAAVVRNNRLYLFFVLGDDTIRYISTTSSDPNGFTGSWQTGNLPTETDDGSTKIHEATRGELSATCINDFQIVLTFTGQGSRRIYTKRMTLNNSSTGRLNLSSSQWLNGKYSRFAVGINHDGVNDVFLTYKDGTSTGSSAIDGLKTDICCGGGNSGLSYSTLPVTGSTRDAGTSLVYLGN